MNQAFKQRRWDRWKGIAVLFLGVAMVAVLGRASFLWHQHYSRIVLALSTMREARHVTSPVLRRHLLHLAAALVGAKPGTVPAALGAAAFAQLEHLGASEWFGSPAVWAIAFLVIVVGVYWMREGHIAWLETERSILKQQMLALARGWASLATDPNPREVMQRILAEVGHHTALGSAAIYRLTDDHFDSLELYASFGPFRLSDQPIPKIFLVPGRGLVGQTIVDNVPRYSGDYGEVDYLIPGVRKPRVGVFPLRYQNEPWGALLLTSNETNWYFTYRNLLDILAQEIAIAAATSELAQAARRNRIMEERAQMQSEILANVSHELRTPLGLVKGYLETLQKSWGRMSPADRGEFLDVALGETHQLEELIEHLLVMSRVDSEEMMFRPALLELGEWFRNVVEHYPVWDRDRIRVVGSVPENTVVSGDPRGLQTALGDLLQNALKYSSGLVDVEFHVAGQTWGFAVRDYGPGVAPSELPKIFERFYRSPAHAQSEIRGSGLGLAIVERIVALHGGSVSGENARPQGFVVRVSLPMGSRQEGDR